MAHCRWWLWAFAAAYLLCTISIATAAGGRPTAVFVFGDSLVDQGMNNPLRFSTAKANFLPNGIDYPGSVPTGRFCNGRIVSDFLSEYWNLEPILAYDDPAQTDETLLRGANYASAGAGILNDTGMIFIQRFPMGQQVELFREHRAKVSALVGDAEATRIFAGASVSINIGANDFLSNYFLPISPRRNRFTMPEYQDLLITELRKHVTNIYEIGARKIVVAGMGPFGCIPLALGIRSLTDKGKCIDHYQQVAMSFNVRLVSLVQEFQQSFTGATVIYSNGFDIVLDMINNPSKYGFTNTNSACCGRGPYKGLIPCNKRDPVCADRSSYIFWDPFHPTEAVNKIISQRVLFGSPADIHPINLSQLFSS